MAELQILPGATFTKAQIKVSQYSFSYVLHAFHTQDQVVLTQYDANIAKDCYDCHPGNNVNCYRDATHNNANIWCTDCHGNLNQRVASGQLSEPWQQSSLPTCDSPAEGINSVFQCHSVPVGGELKGLFGAFINGQGHEGQVLCETCHGSPHDLAPSLLALANVENQTIQGWGTFPRGKNSSYPIGVCGVCHQDKGSMWQMPPHAHSGNRGRWPGGWY